MAALPPKARGSVLAALADRLEAAAEEARFDYAIRVDVARECLWACEVRITPHPHAPGADRSLVAYVAGSPTPEAAADVAVEEALHWLTQAQRDWPEGLA